MSKSLEKGPPPRLNFTSATQIKSFGGGLGVKKNRLLGVWVIYETTQWAVFNATTVSNQDLLYARKIDRVLQ